MSIEAYDYGVKDGKNAERARIREWIKSHRSEFDMGGGVFMYRDHFDSESLLEFLDEEDKQE